MKKQIERFLSSEHGNVGMMFGIMAIPVFMATGGAVDYSNAMSMRQNLQRAIDIGTLGASNDPGENDAREARGKSMFDVNYGGDCTSEPTFSFEGDTTVGTVACAVDTMLLGIIGISTIDISAQSTAARDVEVGSPNVLADACVITLSKTARHAIRINASSALDFDCGLYSRSSHPEAFDLVTTGSFDATTVNTVGGYKDRSNGTVRTVFNTDMPVVADPMEGMEPPIEAGGGCTFPNRVSYNVNTPIVIPPGVYCDGLRVNSNERVTFTEGVYVFRGDRFSLTTGGKVTAENVLFYLEDDTPLSISATGGITLRGRESGEYAGVAIAQSNKPGELATTMSISMSGDIHIDGTIYLPRSKLNISMSGRTSINAGYTSYVADTLNITSSGRYNVYSDYDGVTPLPVLLEKAVLAPIIKLVARIAQ